MRDVLGGARVVDQRIQPPPIGSGRDYSAAIGIIGDVALHDPDLGARATTGIGGRLRFDPARGIVDDHPRALAGDGHGGSGAQSSSRARNQNI